MAHPITAMVDVTIRVHITMPSDILDHQKAIETALNEMDYSFKYCEDGINISDTGIVSYSKPAFAVQL